MLVADDDTPQDRGRFTIVAPHVEDRAITGIRYGLQDESTRINLTTLLQADKSSKGSAKAMLMGLPGMTDEISDAILDWIDADDTPREHGAEAELLRRRSRRRTPLGTARRPRSKNCCWCAG